ncbi:MAG TPA: tryptophan synthase subunit alpha [Longimicrobiales bacterium]|nr:tryptophan synthase subunit alpha [Longimicrobiales bacterium]
MSDSRISRVFARRADEGRGVLVPYITAGFPERDTTVPLMRAIADAGADVIELGVPFSDPLADGPTIQASSFRALQNGTKVKGVFEALREFRETHDTAVVLFTYLNPVVRYGDEAFCRDAVAAGADGLLLTDLPAGSDPELEERISSSGLDLIRLLAPTTAVERVAAVSDQAAGFLYYISRTGVTGARADLPEDLVDRVREIRTAVGLPVAVGFGISSPEQARAVAEVAEGVVVGSALIKTLEAEGVEGAAAFVRGLRQALDG